MRAYLAPLAALLALTLHAADTPVAVHEEPFHKIVFENDYVRLIDVQMTPAQTSLYHRHVIPSVVVYLTKSTNRSESWPAKEILTRDIVPGESRYAPYDEKPLAHRVTNTGAGLFRVFDIELLRKKPADKKALPALPANARPHWDENLARSSNWTLEPGARLELPAGDAALLVVGITGKCTVAHSRAHAPERSSLGWADYRFIPPHTDMALHNAGSERAEVIVLEMR